MYRLYVYNLSKQKTMPHITFFLVFKFYPPIRAAEAYLTCCPPAPNFQELNLRLLSNQNRCFTEF